MFTGLLTSVLFPVLVDFFKSAAPAVSRKFLGVSVDEQIKLEIAGIDRLKALAELDNPHGTPSQWVVDLRAAFRYVSAAVLIVSGVVIATYGMLQTSPEITLAGLEIAAYPFGFIFGERLALSFKPMGK